jgi:alpha-tubulin suppressor-like RCC1 family protein
VKNSLILNDKSIQIIACEGYQSFVFKTNSKILSLRYSWSTRKSVNLVFQDKISKISCGGSHSVFYTENGKVFVMGCNSSGQLGIGKDKGKVGALEDTKPILLLTDKTIKDIICGEEFTILHKTNGKVFGFGKNNHNQMGKGDCSDDNIYEPKLLMKDTSIRKISCGEYHVIYYKNNGDILVCGSNSFGQLGFSNSIFSDGVPNVDTPKFLMNDKKVRLISCGSQHTLIYRCDGDLVGFGLNGHGQLFLDSRTHHSIKTPTVVANCSGIVQLNGQDVTIRFSETSYKHLSIFEQEAVIAFLKVVKRFRRTKLNIPKCIVKEILRRV